MAKIPTIISSEAIRTGTTGPQAGPGSFGAAHDVGDSALQLSRGIRSVTGDVLAVRDARKRHEETRWVNDSYDQEYKYLHDWSKERIEAQDEAMAESFWKHSHERISQYTDKAPSKRAAEMFRGEMQRFVQGRYAMLAKTSEDIRIDKTIDSINSQIQNALGIYRESREMPNSQSVIDLNNEYQRLSGYIDSSFKEMAPGHAAKMREHLAVEMALGTMDYNPAFSKMIIELDKNIDERTRTTLKNQLEASQEHGSRVLADTFTRERANHLVRVEAGQTAAKLPLAIYEQHYGKKHGPIQKADDDFKVDVFNRSNDFTTKYGHWNAGALSAKYRKLEEGRSTAEDKAVLGVLSDKIRDNIALQKSDRVAWLSQYNPELKRLNREVEEATTPESKSAAMSARNFATLKYQGYAPQGAADPEQYLSLSTDDRALMSVDAATSVVTAINRGKASEVIAHVNQQMANFPDKEHQFIAFKNLVELPASGKGLNRMYQLVWTHRDKYWVDSLIGAIDNAKDLGKLNPETLAKMNKAVDFDETWIKFKRTMVDDNSQGAFEVEGYREAISTFANVFMNEQGLDEKKAIKKSISLLVSSELGFTSVNGQPLAITKQRAGKPDRSDGEISDYGRRFEIALEQVDPRRVNAENFPFLKRLQTDEAKWNNFHQQLRDKSFFRLSADGQFVTIYYPDDNGIPFQVTDENKRPFMIYLDELPEFTYEAAPNIMVPRGMAPIQKSQTQDKDVYDVSGNLLGLGHIFGTYRSKSNWPTHPKWIRTIPR